MHSSSGKTMKHQSNILGFFQPIEKRFTSKGSEAGTATATHKSSDAEHESCTDLTDVSVIADTPDAARIFRPSHLPPSPTVLTKPIVPTQKSTTRRKLSAHRRSSLIVRRQAELAEKHSSKLAFDGGPPNETSLERELRQTSASIKLRRGNYDSLNYAPIDQVKANTNVPRSSSVPGGRPGFSRRSEILVNKALCMTSKVRRPTSEVIDHCTSGESLEKRSKYRDHSTKSISKSESVCSKLVKTMSNNVAVASNLNNLNSEEVGALSEILNQLEDDIHSEKSSSILTSRKIMGKNIAKSNKASVPTVPISAAKSLHVQECQIILSTDEDDLKPILDDSLTQLNLSDWSANDDLKDTSLDLLNNVTNSPGMVQLPTTTFYRGQITYMEKSSNHIMLRVDLDKNSSLDQETTTSIEVVLSDSWLDSDLHLGDAVQLSPGLGYQVQDRKVKISDSSEALTTGHGFEKQLPAALIQHPDFLIPSTKLVGSLYCMRRSVLEQFWPSGESGPEGAPALGEEGPTQSNSRYLMLTGNLLHELFQKLITSPKLTTEDGEAFIRFMLLRANVIMQAYTCRTKIDKLHAALSEQLKTILRWIEVHCRFAGTSHSSNARSPIVHQVLGVEENIWSTRFGLKGKIDLSLLCQAPDSWLCKPQTVHSDNSSRLSLVPMELKTGRPTYSVEHKGQVLLYLLMLYDRYGPQYTVMCEKDIQTALFGWLVYLRDTVLPNSTVSHPGLIEPNVSNFRGLLQTRNRIAARLLRVTGTNLDDLQQQRTIPDAGWTPELPPPTKSVRTCQMCPVQLACSLLSPENGSNGERSDTKCARSNSNITNVSDLLSAKRAHLTWKHLSFFLHWSRLNLLELADTERLETVVRRIVTSRSVTPSVGNGTQTSVPPLRVVYGGRGTLDGQWISILAPDSADTEDVLIKSDFNPGPGDFVIVSSYDCKHIGITLGTVLTPQATNEINDSEWQNVANTRNSILLSTDGPLPKWIDRFRLDRYVTSKGTQLNLSNLVSLMEDSELGEYLRRLIVDRAAPSFTSTLSKQLVQDVRALLKPMNLDQRAAILRVLMANDYVLIQGYPGTGKTQTLTTLLRVLALLGRKTLIVAHTHSAVDNLLGRVVQSGEKRVLRLGSVDRVRPDLLDYCFEYVLTRTSSIRGTEDPVDRCQRLIDEAVVIGCTALAASGGADSRHAALCRAQFDLVLIDEATQLLLPTALGSLFCLRPKPSGPGARFVLVGDPYQLPPLVQSFRARQAGLECSLFSHLLRSEEDSASSDACLNSDDRIINQCAPKKSGLVELTLQYRMNRCILFLVNELTYSGSIRAADSRIAEATLADVLNPGEQQENPVWLTRAYSTDLSDAVLFLDTHLWNCCSGRSKSGTHLQNPTEAKLIQLILSGFIRLGLKMSDVGVIAPHRKQVALIKALLAESVKLTLPSTEGLDSVEVNTVDQFQGRDKRVIVLSLTVCSGATVMEDSSNPNERTGGCSGLLDNLPRLTVGLTRAKHKLLLIGCSGTCARSSPADWATRSLDSVNGSLNKLFTLLQRVGAIETLPLADQDMLST